MASSRHFVKPIRSRHAGRLAVFLLWAAVASPPLLGQDSGTDAERSVLMSSRRAERGDRETSRYGAIPSSAGAIGLEEPLTPVAVATDQEPKLATPTDGSDASPTLDRSPASPPLASSRRDAQQYAPSADLGNSPLAEQRAAPPQIETAKFNGVQPGTSSTDQLIQAWGEPQSKSPSSGQGERWTYDLEPFNSVYVDLSAGDATGIVRSIQLELAKQVGPVQLANQLRLDQFRPALIRDSSGTELGVVFPERGVVFSFSPQSTEHLITHVLLEPVSAQPFVLRAEEDLYGPFAQNLLDLRAATQLNPQSAHAWWQIAALELNAGRFTAAEQAAERAVELDPTNTAFRLRRAACQAQLGKHEQALSETRSIADSPDAPAHIQAEALVQLARLRSVASASVRGDGHNAIQLYQQAIEIAGELSTSQAVDVRRTAKAVLVDAHLGMAHEIARGQWREKEKVVPQWLERASAFAEDMIRTEGGGQEYRLQVAVGALEALGEFPPTAGPAEWVREAEVAADALLAEHAQDELWVGRIHWEAGQAYLHAVRVEHARRRPEDALRYGESALAHFRDGARVREASPLGEHLVGRLYFHLGAVHAIHYQDHAEAVEWFDKATPLLARQTPQVPGADIRLHGDALVSMGVSYWDQGARDRALEMTQRGAEVLQSAVQSGALERTTLGVAYGNLANMHQQLGHQSEADRYVEIAERLQGTSRQ